MRIEEGKFANAERQDRRLQYDLKLFTQISLEGIQMKSPLDSVLLDSVQTDLEGIGCLSVEVYAGLRYQGPTDPPFNLPLGDPNVEFVLNNIGFFVPRSLPVSIELKMPKVEKENMNRMNISIFFGDRTESSFFADPKHTAYGEYYKDQYPGVMLVDRWFDRALIGFQSHGYPTYLPLESAEEFLNQAIFRIEKF